MTTEKEIEQLTRLLELELAQKRALWKQASQRAKSIRVAGFAFLFLVIVACSLGAYFAFIRISEQRANPTPRSVTDH